MPKTVLILGGYGNVGRTIAASLIENTNAQLIIAGRRYHAAEKLAQQLGGRAHSRQIDATRITDFDATLANVDLAVVCEVGSEDFVLTTRVQAENAQTLYQSGLRGQREADVTARVAAEVAHQDDHAALSCGVHHSEQVFELSSFLSLIEETGVTLQETNREVT